MLLILLLLCTGIVYCYKYRQKNIGVHAQFVKQGFPFTL